MPNASYTSWKNTTRITWRCSFCIRAPLKHQYVPCLAWLVSLSHMWSAQLHYFCLETMWVFNEASCRIDRTMLAILIKKNLTPTWGPAGAGRTHLGPVLATWNLLSGEAYINSQLKLRYFTAWHIWNRVLFIYIYVLALSAHQYRFW